MHINSNLKLLEAFGNGDRRALARLLTFIQNGESGIPEFLDKIYPETGAARRIGITGPPGAGKSTLVNKLVGKFREKEKSVGVIAFDPTSPFTGGALLGDRVRMEAISKDPEVFIRSMATRGHLGGLAVGVDEACDLMDAFGKERIMIETVGVGQSELEIAQSADTTIVVLVPQSGDAIQALKAGLMEIADIYVLNKCDRDGADIAYRELLSVINLKHYDEGWKPPIVKTIAENGDGIDILEAKVNDHFTFLQKNNKLDLRRTDRKIGKVHRLVEDSFQRVFWNDHRKEMQKNGLVVGNSPYELAKTLFNDYYEEISNEWEKEGPEV